MEISWWIDMIGDVLVYEKSHFSWCIRNCSIYRKQYTRIRFTNSKCSCTRVQHYSWGKVIEVQSKYFIIESKELNESVTIYTDFQANAKPGEYVKVNSNGPLLQNAFTTSLTANSVEHFELAPGNYEQYTVGHVSEVSSNELLVTYIDNNGNQRIFVYL